MHYIGWNIVYKVSGINVYASNFDLFVEVSVLVQWK